MRSRSPSRLALASALGLLSCTRERPEVLILADTFISGADPSWAAFGRLTRIGVRRIDLHAFIVERRLVRKDEYAACVEARACPALRPDPFAGYPDSPHHDEPEQFASFDNAQSYCRWKGMRLLSQDEFERLARGTDGWASVCHKEPFHGCSDKAISRDGVRQLTWEQWIDRRDEGYPLGATMGFGNGVCLGNEVGLGPLPVALHPFRCARDAPASFNKR